MTISSDGRRRAAGRDGAVDHPRRCCVPFASPPPQRCAWRRRSRRRSRASDAVDRPDVSSPASRSSTARGWRGVFAPPPRTSSPPRLRAVTACAPVLVRASSLPPSSDHDVSRPSNEPCRFAFVREPAVAPRRSDGYLGAWTRWLGSPSRGSIAPRGSGPIRVTMTSARLRKGLLVLVCVLILPISFVWGAIYLAFGGAMAGLIAWLYLIISVGAIATFSRTRDIGVVPSGRAARHPARPDDLDGLSSGGFVDLGRRRPVGHPRPARLPVFDGWRARRALVHRLRRGCSSVSGIVGELAQRCSVPAARVVEGPDHRAHVVVARCRGVRLLVAVRAPARGGVGGPAGRAGPGREPAPEHPPPIDRGQAQGRHRHDRGPVRRGLDPVRRRRRLHAAVGPPAAGRGGRDPRPPVHPLRPAGRSLRGREDQDDR